MATQTPYSKTVKEYGDAGKRHHEFTKKLADFSDQTLNKVDDAVDTIEARAKEYSHTIESYVHSNPLKALGIAAAAGAFLALLLRR